MAEWKEIHVDGLSFTQNTINDHFADGTSLGVTTDDLWTGHISTADIPEVCIYWDSLQVTFWKYEPFWNLVLTMTPQFYFYIKQLTSINFYYGA